MSRRQGPRELELDSRGAAPGARVAGGSPAVWGKHGELCPRGTALGCRRSLYAPVLMAQTREGKACPAPRLPEPPLQRGRLASTRCARHPQGFRHRVLRHYHDGQALSLVWHVPGTQASHSFRPHKVAVKNEVLCPPLTSSAQRSRLPRQSKTTLELVPRPVSVSWCPGPHTAHTRTSPDFL